MPNVEMPHDDGEVPETPLWLVLVWLVPHALLIVVVLFWVVSHA